MVILALFGVFLACQSSAVPACDDECHGALALATVVERPSLAIQELAQVRDSRVRDRLLLDIIELPNLHVGPADAGALCDLAHTQPIRDLCHRRLSRPHLNTDRSVEVLPPDRRPPSAP